jgi:hypothetical protein
MSCTNGFACEGEGDHNICDDCFEAVLGQLDRLVQAYRKDYRSPELETEVAAAEEMLREVREAPARLEEST